MPRPQTKQKPNYVASAVDDLHRTRVKLEVGRAINLVQANAHLLDDQMIDQLTKVLDKVTKK